MTNEDMRPTRFCHQCGRPLVEAEEEAGYICTDCQGKQAPRGLLPGAAWTRGTGAVSSSLTGSTTERQVDTKTTGGAIGEQPSEVDSATNSGGSVAEGTIRDIANPAFRSIARIQGTARTNSDEFDQADWHQQGPARPGDGEVNSDQSSVHRVNDAWGGYGLPDPSAPQNRPAGSEYPRALWPAPTSYQEYARQYWPYPPPEALQPDPDYPRWGWLGGLGVWLFSVGAIIVIPLIAVIIFLAVEGAGGARIPLTNGPELQRYVMGPSGVLVQVAGLFAAHIITIGLVWVVATHMGKLSLFKTLGFRWDSSESFRRGALWIACLVPIAIEVLIWDSVVEVIRENGRRHLSAAIGSVLFMVLLHLFAAFSIWVVVTRRGSRPFVQTIMGKWNEAAWLQKIGFVLGIIVAMIAAEIILGALMPESKETDFEKLLKTSQGVRVALAALAVLSAPLVEEGVYRGVLYSGLRRSAPMWVAVGVVTLLFGMVHVPQYWGSWASISSIMVLSFTLTLVRAKTRSLLPCIIIHTLYNMTGAVGILGHGGK